MKTRVYFSRLQLLRNAAHVAPLLEILQPKESGARIAVDHRLLWTVMPLGVRERATRARSNGGAESTFLWRADRKEGCYYLLGPKPEAEGGFFSIESKAFEPSFSRGDRLAFELRLNATVDRKVRTDAAGNPIRKRCDVAMDLLKSEEQRKGRSQFRRLEHRMVLAERAAEGWFAGRVEKFGIRLEKLLLEGYRAEKFPRNAGKSGVLGVFDLKGALTVTYPERFVERLVKGFGRGKAFGCGLMLVRRIT